MGWFEKKIKEISPECWVVVRRPKAVMVVPVGKTLDECLTSEVAFASDGQPGFTVYHRNAHGEVYPVPGMDVTGRLPDGRDVENMRRLVYNRRRAMFKRQVEEWLRREERRKEAAKAKFKHDSREFFRELRPLIVKANEQEDFGGYKRPGLGVPRARKSERVFQ